MPRPSLKRRPDGRFCCRYKGRFFYGSTQSAAYAARDAYKKQLEAGLRAGAGAVLLSDYAAQWVFVYKNSVSIRTYNDCVRALDSLIETIGDKPIRDVYPMDIQKAYNTQAAKSKSQISKFTRTVSALFASAVNNRMITSNPCASAAPPRGGSGTHRAIDPWERSLILQSDHRLTPAVMLMLYTGLRRGEALALDVSRDVDFKAKTITVREAVRFDANAPILDTPKTEAGLRTVPLPDLLVPFLRPIRGLVAPSASGSHMSETAFTRAWQSYLTHLEQLRNGDTKRWHGRRQDQDEEWLLSHPWQSVSIRPHDLRHSYCTMLYDSGVDVKTAQKWMGHQDVATTMRIYTHLSAQRESQSVASFHRFLNTDPLYNPQIGSQIGSLPISVPSQSVSA